MQKTSFIALALLGAALSLNAQSTRTTLKIQDARWQLNNSVTYPGAPAEGLLMNVRMVNATFEDRAKREFDSNENTSRFLAAIPDYARQGVRAFTFCLQGGMPGYEGAINSAFDPNGSLRADYLERMEKVLDACDRLGVPVILGCYYQRQDQILKNTEAVKNGLLNVVRWIGQRGYRHVALEIANEYDHAGFDHEILRSVKGELELIRLVKQHAPDLLVSTSGLGHGRMDPEIAAAADFILIHFNGTSLEKIPERIAALKRFKKPIVVNEDDKTGEQAARAAELSVKSGASWGLMLKNVNQYVPFEFKGPADDPIVYRKIKELTTAR